MVSPLLNAQDILQALRVLVVDDDPATRSAMVAILEQDGCLCRTAGNGVEALALLDSAECDLLISDLRMPEMDGMTLLRALSARRHKFPVIAVTAHGDIDVGLEAIHLGAADFVFKPITRQQLRWSVTRTMEHWRLLALNRRLARQVAHPPAFENLIGRSPAMLEVFRMVARIAPTNANVLITGESGTGKEEVARAVHRLSARKDKRLNVVDCGAIPENLVESVLFGHRRGAFTGADRDRVGLLEYSNGGTVFFDEIGELPIHLQAKLLRVIQERTFRPLGENKDIPIDIRIIAATNRDLKAAVQAGQFREDLFYRLNVVALHLPPLRDRREDIEDLTFHFLDLFADQFPDLLGFSPDAMQALRAYAWPGNIRELRNAIERAASLASGDAIVGGDLPEAVGNTPAAPAAPSAGWPDLEDLATFRRAMEREYLNRLLALHDGNISHAAQHAGLSRKALYRMLKDAALPPESFR